VPLTKKRRLHAIALEIVQSDESAGRRTGGFLPGIDARKEREEMDAALLS